MTNSHFRLGPAINRHALITFVALAIVFIAQLTWWAIFHIRLIDEKYEQYVNLAESRRTEITDLLSRSFEEARDLLLVDAETLSPSELEKLRETYRSNTFVGGFRIQTKEGEELVSEGSISGDAGVRIAKANTIITVSVSYEKVRELAQAYEPQLGFSPPHPDSVFFSALSRDNFPLDESEAARYKEDRASSLSMVYWEGAFFVLLTTLGLGLIFRALIRSEEARRMQENFLMAVTHELRTPLASIKLNIQGLTRGKLPEEKVQRIGEIVDNDLDRLSGLIEDLLDANKSQSDRRKEAHEVSLNEYVMDYLAACQHAFESKGVLHELNAPSDSPIVSINSTELTRALDIVTHNAVKFSDSDRSLTFEISQNSGMGRIDITDRGIGIESREINKIFERFYRSGSELTRNRPGTGLGLYLAREILRSAGGDIRATSPGLGNGSTFSLLIPLHKRSGGKD